MQDKQIVLFLRKKTPGENSIEELAKVLTNAIPSLKLRVLPEYNNTLKGIYQNIKFARKNSGDINHFFSPDALPIAPFITGIKIVTWHDVATDFYTRNRILRAIKRNIFRKIPMSFCHIITAISKHTRDELIQLGISESKIKIINNPYSYEIKQQKEIPNNPPIILHIGTAARKNLTRVILALKGVPCKLIIVGILDDQQKNLLQECSIDYINYYDIPFSKIITLYKLCNIVSFPSLYEGFGMPVLEAQATGRILVTSKIDTIREISGGAAIFVDQESIDSIREGFLRAINEPHENIIQQGIINSMLYHINHIANQYSQLYEVSYAQYGR